MKKILFTIQWYPSLNSANVLCDDEIIRELKKNNEYEIHCLVCRAYKQPKYEQMEGIHVHRFSLSPLWILYTWGKQNEDKLFGRLILRINRLCLRIKQLLTIPLYPCYEPLLKWRFAREAIKLHKKEHFDLVISEHHGIETLCAGYALKCFDDRVKYVPILWDPIVGKEPAKYLKKSYAEKCLSRFEERILSMADTVVAMRSHREVISGKCGDKPYYQKIIFLDLPRLTRPLDPGMADEGRFIDRSCVNILYSGLVNKGDRNPRFVIDLLGSLDMKVNLMFFCIGEHEDFSAAMANFNGKLQFHGYVPKEQLLQLYANADIFLNLGNSNPCMVPSKIFEYMCWGKPVISTYSIEDDSSKSYLAEYPLAFLIDRNRSDKETLKQELRDFIIKTSRSRLSYEQVATIFPNNTPGKYIRLINELLD